MVKLQSVNRPHSFVYAHLLYQLASWIKKTDLSAGDVFVLQNVFLRVYVTVSGGYGQFFRRMSPGLAISYELWSCVCVCVRVFRRADSDAGAEMLRSSWQRDVSRDQAGEIMTGALRRPCTRRRRPTCADGDDGDCSLPASVVMTSSLSPSMTSSIGEPENTQLRRPVSTSSITDNNWNAAVDGGSTPDRPYWPLHFAPTPIYRALLPTVPRGCLVTPHASPR